MACVHEETLKGATYLPDGNGGFKIQPDDPEQKVHCWPTVDPDLPPLDEAPWWGLCRYENGANVHARCYTHITKKFPALSRSLGGKGREKRSGRPDGMSGVETEIGLGSDDGVWWGG